MDSMSNNYNLFIISFIIYSFKLFWIFIKFIYIDCNFLYLLIFRQIKGFSLFDFLVNFERYLMLTKFYKIYVELGNIGFNIFLFHHIIKKDVLSVTNPNIFYLHLKLLVEVIISIIIYSEINLMVVNSILKSELFIKLESLIIFSKI